MRLGLVIAGWSLAGVALVALVRMWRVRQATLESVARVGHELRGPLTAIGLAVAAERRERAVAGGGSPPARRLEAVERELGRVALALDDLAALARPDAAARRGGRSGTPGAPRRLDPVALDALAADSVGAWSAYAAARGVRLHPPSPTAGARVLGDPGRLAQATGNLIANAIEHGGGEVRVRCRCTPAAVRVEVVDRGPGLPAPVSELARRARGGRGRRGRGLAIAAAVAAGHGGQLVAAAAQTGARVVLELPRAPR